MSEEPRNLRWSGRFSRSALFLSASALSLAPVASALAGPVENVPFFSMYGGVLFNESNSNIQFDPAAFGLGGLDSGHPGDDGGMFGFEVGKPISPDWDVRSSLTGVAFGDNLGDNGAGTATIQDRLNFQYLDAELGYRPGVLNQAIRLFAGPRLFRAKSEIDYDYAFTAGFGPKTGRYDRDVDLWGAGARVGAQAMVPFGSRFSLSLLGSGSAIAAHEDSDYHFDTTGFLNVSSGEDHISGWRGIYDVEGVAALNFQLNNRVQLQAGYQVQQWWNLTTDVGLVDGNETDASSGKGNLLSHGPVGRITVKLP